MHRRLFIAPILVAFLSIFAISVHAQYVVKGKIVDMHERYPLGFAQVFILCEDDAVLCDKEGQFSVNIYRDTCQLKFRYGMYEEEIRTFVFTKRKEYNVTITLKPKTNKIDNGAKVSVGKYEEDPLKSTSSVVSLSTKNMESQAIKSADQLVNQAGGIVVVDNEPQIRGGSGYSSGMGSRVMILLDDMPLLRPDAGRPMWNFIPMESIEQIDILKGAASVLYGSSALTGVINVRTAYPRTKPFTSITVHGGVYSKPKDKYKASWTHNNPLKGGVSFLHSRIIKKNFDLVVGAEYFNDQSYIGPAEPISTTIQNNTSSVGKYEKRYRFNVSTRYRFEKVRGLSVALAGNVMYTDHAQSYLWYDADTNIYRSYEGSLTMFKDLTFYVDPVVKYIAKDGSTHTFKNRILFSDSRELTGELDSKALMAYDEYQFSKAFKRIGMEVVAGVVNQYANSNGPVFSGGDPNEVDASNASVVHSNNFSIYSQLEQAFLKHRNLVLQVGGRWEFYKLYGAAVETEVANKPVVRAGVNYQIMKTLTAFRASVGQGFRYPSIGEKFISLTIGDYGFYPNPELESESSWNLEAGVMQPFKILEFKGMIDVAYFHQIFDNYVEFCMGPWANTDLSLPIYQRMGYKFLNVGGARVTGLDIAVMGEGKMGKNTTYRLMASYTWSNPISTEPDYVYYQEGNIDYSFNTTSSDKERKVLKYRIEHMAKLDLEFTVQKRFVFGMSGTYYSSMRNIDRFMYTYDAHHPDQTEGASELYEGLDLPFEGLYNFEQAHDNGSIVFDTRIGYNFDKLTTSFVVKNIFNVEYALRPLYAEPPRTFTLQLIYKI